MVSILAGVLLLFSYRKGDEGTRFRVSDAVLNTAKLVSES